MNVDYALYHAVRDYQGGAEALAVLMKISGSSLSHKANPRNAGAHASPSELVDIMLFTGDKGPLRAMAAELGEMCIPMPDLLLAGPESWKALAHTVQEFSEMLTVSTEGMGDGRITDNEQERIERKALQAVAAIHELVAVARRMNQAAKPAGEAI